MNKLPNLRFKEFSEYWICEKIGNITSLVKDGSHGTHQDVKKGPYLLSAKNIKNGKVVIEDDDRKISEEEYNAIYKNYSLEVGDILLSIVGTIGRVAIVNEIQPIAFQRSVAILRFNKMNSKFIECCINNRGFQNDLLKYQVVSAQPGIYLNDLKKLKINFPELEEQEKIASFFSLIDKKIELQTEKVEELKNYKKGIMQKIFSQELRFKDENGNEYPSWKEYKVKDLFDVTRGVVIAKNEISDKSNETFKYAVYSSQTSNNGILGYDQTFDFDGNYLTWTTDGANAGRVFCRSGKFRCTNVCGVLVEKDNTIGYANKLVAEILNKETPKHVSYVGNPKLMNGVMAEIKLSIPSLEEQTKIDKLINQLDIKIESEQMKLSLLVDYKKGLLQQMFI